MFTALSGISVNDLQPSTGPGPQSSTPGTTAPKQAPAPVPQSDTVKLSVTQQVRNLHSEGEGPGQIASSLGLDSSQVNNDLYVSLTWPQLLSKVASSSLSLGPAPSELSVTGSPAPVGGSGAVVFPGTKGAVPASTASAAGTKAGSASDVVIFPKAKDTPLPVVLDDLSAKAALPSAASSGSRSKDATAA